MKNPLYRAGITSLHIEPTSACNARCPQCARNVYGSQLTPLEMIDSEFHPEWLRRLTPLQFETVVVNGNYGDICMHSDPVGLLSAIKALWPHTSLQINTNGAALHPDVWYQIGSLTFAKTANSAAGIRSLPVRAEFSIDGVDQDTHSRYRRNTRLDRILENAHSFMEGGGVARWVFTEFQHNSHQVAAAQAMAEELGFDEFWVRPSSRHTDRLPTPVVDNSAKIIDWIHPPGETTENFNREYRKAWGRNLEMAHAKQKHTVGRTDVHIMPTGGIDCWATKNQSLYCDARGYVFPCCWLGRPELWKNTTRTLSTATDFNDTATNSLLSILDHEFWQKLDDSLAYNALDVCDRTCGVRNRFSTQEENTVVKVLKNQNG